jgi:hypothetical protein
LKGPDPCLMAGGPVGGSGAREGAPPAGRPAPGRQPG